ncbi:MAG: hypothetical protein IOD15_12145 [Phycisphaerales bacterium]|nr:hypothetical protein [Phycisphaerales bacterium]
MNPLSFDPLPQQFLAARLSRSRTARFIFPDTTVDVPALTTLTDRWRACLAQAGISPGSRVILAMPPGPAWLAAALACWSDGIAVAPAGPSTYNFDDLVRSLDAGLILGPVDHPLAVDPEPDGGPPADPALGRAAAARPLPQIALVLPSSTPRGPWHGYSWLGVLHAVAAHAPRLALAGSLTATRGDWAHPLHIITDVLAPLLCGGSVFLDADADVPTGPVSHPVITHRNGLWPFPPAALPPTLGGLILTTGSSPPAPSILPPRTRLAFVADGILGSAALAAPAEVADWCALNANRPDAPPSRWLGRPLAGQFLITADGGETLFRSLACSVATFLGEKIALRPDASALGTGLRLETVIDNTASQPAWISRGRTDGLVHTADGRQIAPDTLRHALVHSLNGVADAHVWVDAHGKVHILLATHQAAAPSFEQVGRAIGPASQVLGMLLARPLLSLPRTPEGRLDGAKAAQMLAQFATDGHSRSATSAHP